MKKVEFLSVRGVPAELKYKFRLACLKQKRTVGKEIIRIMQEYVEKVKLENKQ
jgi:hypothetical protein